MFISAPRVRARVLSTTSAYMCVCVRVCKYMIALPVHYVSKAGVVHSVFNVAMR